MARRKYVKENNLVKAINTDSLELQKPLVNEYYDINVHNSNMDKIDLGYKQNKNDISNINYELSKTENTKYTTENGVKEFSCKDGYVDNVVIEGETLVNICQLNTVDASNSDGVTRTIFKDMKRCANNTFTLCNFTDKIITFTKCTLSNMTYSGVFNVDANSKRVVEVDETESIYGVDFQPDHGWSNSDASIYKTSMYAILEGDHTDKPISYFEGLKSVGQGDKIEVLTKNSDETKQDKKQILTTLRSLPNGVKDTIEKRGNKYYKIKRCEEIFLNGSESNWDEGGQSNTSTIKPNIPMPNSIGKVNTNLYCDKFKAENIYDSSNINEGIYISSSNTLHIRLNKTKADNLATFKTWLSQNPVTVVYELATPIVEELPNFNPQSFSDKTTLLLNSGVVQGECNFEVTNSLGSELEVLKGKVSSLDDDIQKAFQYGDNVKTQLVDKLISEGLDVSTNNSFEELIGSIALGKKWASGVINSGATKGSFEFLNSASTSSHYLAKITNLDFVPSIVIATSDYSNNYYGYLSMFYLFGEQKRFYCCNNVSYRSASNSLTGAYKEKNGLQCDSTGVTLPFAVNDCDYTWIAIE